jgi:shikimate dehydrogenase
MTRPYAEVIGDPIAHSKSPLIHNFWLGKLGIDAEYRACHVRPGELADYFVRRREDSAWRGCNVTLPHKERVAAFLDMPDPRIGAIGAANTVFRLAGGGLGGTNTDVDGVREAIAAIPDGRSVVIGAGGAARAAFALFAGDSRASVTVIARNAEKARHAAADCGLSVDVAAFAPASGAFAGARLVINATQLGMTGEQPMPDGILDQLAETAPDALVFDMVYAPLATALLQRARVTGRRTAVGLQMLIGQAATAFERFFGARPPRGCDAELRELLTS